MWLDTLGVHRSTFRAKKTLFPNTQRIKMVEKRPRAWLYSHRYHSRSYRVTRPKPKALKVRCNLLMSPARTNPHLSFLVPSSLDVLQFLRSLLIWTSVNGFRGRSTFKFENDGGMPFDGPPPGCGSRAVAPVYPTAPLFSSNDETPTPRRAKRPVWPPWLQFYVRIWCCRWTTVFLSLGDKRPR